MNTSQALRRAVFFNAGPVLGLPAPDLFLVALDGPTLRFLGAKPEGPKQPADVVGMVADAETRPVSTPVAKITHVTVKKLHFRRS